jgi:molybdopterin converting factor small subunit
MMNVTVKFTSYSSLAGTSACVLELPVGATVSDLASLLAERFPSLFPRAERAIYLVNQRTGTRDTRLTDGDQVLMLQVLAGG